MNTLFAARAEARRNFDAHRGLPAGSGEMSKQIAHAEDVATFLRENVVQGQAGDTEGNYSICTHAKASLRWLTTLQSCAYTNTRSGGITRT
jgi:complex III assembly factor LYRM7